MTKPIDDTLSSLGNIFYLHKFKMAANENMINNKYSLKYYLALKMKSNDRKMYKKA